MQIQPSTAEATNRTWEARPQVLSFSEKKKRFGTQHKKTTEKTVKSEEMFLRIGVIWHKILNFRQLILVEEIKKLSPKF